MKNLNDKENSNNQADINILTQHSKNEEMASNTIGSHQKKRGNYTRDKLYRRNRENNIRLWKTIENKIGLQSNPIGKVVNLSKKTFIKKIPELLVKILILFQPQKYIISAD